MTEPPVISISENEENTNNEELIPQLDNNDKTNKRDVTFSTSILFKKKYYKYYTYEKDANQRQRVKMNLLEQLDRVIQEYCERVKGDAVIITMSKGPESNCHIVGSDRLKAISKKFIKDIKENTAAAMKTNETTNGLMASNPDPNLFPLPPLRVNDTPVTLEKMSQAHLRAFIPLMLKYSLGRGKPGWGKKDHQPVWWPKDIPWANVRTDSRPPEEKAKLSWSHTLRRIVKCCYQYHGRHDLIGSTVNEPMDAFQLDDEEMTNECINNDLNTFDDLFTIDCIEGTDADNIFN